MSKGDPVSTKARNRRNRFARALGITVAQYEALSVQQHGLCAICGNEETSVFNGRVRRLAVDHCHATKRIRGLLCYRCNHALGIMRDNVTNLRAAALYVETADTGLRAAPGAKFDPPLISSDSILDELIGS